MPTFMDSLAANPNVNGASNSNIYSMPAATTNNDALSLVNQLKDREMRDFKDKANFMSNLSLQQEQRMRLLYDPNKDRTDNHTNPADATNVLPPQQTGQISPVEQQQLQLERDKLNQQGKLGQEAADTRAAQEKLNQEKSDQIHQQKINELTTKQDEYKQKMDAAQQALTDKTKNLEDQLALHKTIAENTKAYHDSEMALNDLKFKKSESDHKDAMDAMQKKLDEASHTTTTTTINPDGTKKTVDTRKGSATDTVQAVGKDGKTYTIPKDKLDDMDSDGTPHWKAVGGDDVPS